MRGWSSQIFGLLSKEECGANISARQQVMELGKLHEENIWLDLDFDGEI
jgi:hypothetical protein